jgi:glutaredoxin 3
MARVLMYCTATCPYCISAERLLVSKGVSAVDKVRVDLEPLRRAEMTEMTGRTSVPQIWVGDTYVGGCDDLYALDGAGKLEPMLARA